jgi:hypothetical protein
METNIQNTKTYRVLKALTQNGYNEISNKAMEEFENIWLHKYIWVGNDPFTEKDVLLLLEENESLRKRLKDSNDLLKKYVNRIY